MDIHDPVVELRSVQPYKSGVDIHPDLVKVPWARSSGITSDMVRGISLVVMSGVIAFLVLLTDRLLLDGTAAGSVQDWLVLSVVLFVALLVLSRASRSFSFKALTWLDKTAVNKARARSQSRQSIPKVSQASSPKQT